MKNRTIFLFVMLIIPVLAISAPSKYARRIMARISVDLCRQAGHKDDSLFKCFFLLNKQLEEANTGINDKAFVDICVSEQAIDDKFQDKSTIFRTAVRECLESEKDFETSRDSILRVASCLDAKGFNNHDVDTKVIAEEDSRRRMLNQMEFDPQIIAGLLEKLKNHPFIIEQ
ncbi:hypothetical protein A3F66_03495 [candidate division TM6 bacterium RIFCSPHIGHO2_12_FULL_32_22]|nr:MAG: hypothetical protein A3F66_03495 [candidate division TM6 bacterium RIFCSPHIGHO2_12_FULL_32_22]